MTATLLAAFAAACVLLAITPGPNMALIIAATLSGGLGGGLITLAGTMTGLGILVAIATVGMTSVMLLMADWFEVIRWVGAVYLIVLGGRQLWGWWRLRRALAARRDRTDTTAPSASVQLAPDLPKVRAASGITRYTQGLLVSLSNPKVLLFLGAFFPQFVNPDAAPGPQLVILGVLFLAILCAVDVAYTVAVARARAGIDINRLRALDALSGLLLVAGGLVLATARRP